MADDARVESYEHGVLLVVVPLRGQLLSAPGRGDGPRIVRGIVVDRNPVNVVQATDEVIDGSMSGELRHNGRVGGPRPLAFEADHDVDLRSVLDLQALGLYEVCLVPREEHCEGAFGVVELEVLVIYLYLYGQKMGNEITYFLGI